jgi:hypothetical protein
MPRCQILSRALWLWVAAAVLANNLMKIAAMLTQRSLRKRKVPNNIPRVFQLVAEQTRCTSFATTHVVRQALRELATKIASKDLANADIRRQSIQVLLGN